MDVERALVSKIATSGQIEDAISGGIRPDRDHFADEECREVYSHMLDHHMRYGQPPSLDALRDDIPDFEWVSAKDPIDYLIDRQAVLIRRRKADEKLIELAEAVDDPERAEKIELEFLEVARELAIIVPSHTITRFKDIDRRIRQYEMDLAEGKPPGIPFGFPTIDLWTGGIQAHELVAFQAFTGIGKSTLIIKFVSNLWAQGITPLYISLEMEHKVIFRKIDAMFAGMSYRELKQLKLSKGDMENWREFAEKVKKSSADIPVIDKIKGCTVEDVFAATVREKPDAVVVDFVQQMRSSRTSGTKWMDMEEVAYGLKDNARVLGIPVIVASQTNRQGAKEGGTLENVGAGISINQASDIVVGLRQTDEMRELTPPELELRVVKNRDGQLGDVLSIWDHDTLTYREKTMQDMFGSPGRKRLFAEDQPSEDMDSILAKVKSRRNGGEKRVKDEDNIFLQRAA